MCLKKIGEVQNGKYVGNVRIAWSIEEQFILTEDLFVESQGFLKKKKICDKRQPVWSEYWPIWPGGLVVFYSCHCQYTQSGYKTGKVALLHGKSQYLFTKIIKT